MSDDVQRLALRDAFVEFSRTRDTSVRERLIEAHLGLANHLARRFTGRGEPFDDLLQVASLALVKAVDRFDPERGVEFSTFATRTILGELKRHFRDKGWFVRAPRRVQELYLQVGHEVGALTQELGRPPTIAEIAAAAGVGEDDVIEALEAGQAYRSGSLDAVGPEGDALADRLGSEDAALGGAEDRVFLSPALDLLPARERTIVRLRFVEGLTQSEIAKHIGISQMHVSRLLNRSLDVLRRAIAETVPGAEAGTEPT
ncbi:MAG TPA: SigB/SigF/SigG family RNA polymerase sigma factor [Acidimicrobiales bacterium]|nr:SigB/SigF/SigG family RNA polymerase sigma factor [Acidimicrobiales bacterium]